MKKLNIRDRNSKEYVKKLKQRVEKISSIEVIRNELSSKRSRERRKILINIIAELR